MFNYYKQQKQVTYSCINTRSGQYHTHAHSHITRPVAAKDGCFGVVGPYQHGIADARNGTISPK